MKEKAKISFYGGVDSVTGANFVLTLKEADGKETRVMVDCGLCQGAGSKEENAKPFAYNPAQIDFLIITHAHMDHIGKIPKLVKDGFAGTIFSTAPTMEISKPMLADAAKIMAREKTGEERPLFGERDVSASFEKWRAVSYEEKTNLGPATFILKDAGHILGSAMTEISFAGKKIVFTGDLGNSPSPLLEDTKDIGGANFLVMESVYGDRNHETKEERLDELENVLRRAIDKGGTILIPSFSVEKTQVILNELNYLIEKGKIQSVPVFLDSPLAIAVTDIYKKYADYFNMETRQKISSGDDIFHFPKLTLTKTRGESVEIEKARGPKIIMAGSGMSEGGRIISHEKTYLPDPKNTIVFLGYQAAGTLGRQIEEGVSPVEIDGEKVPVRASVEKIEGYSSHKDSDNLVAFAEKAGDTLKEIFVVMGEPKASSFLAERMRDELGVKAVCPEKEKAYQLF